MPNITKAEFDTMKNAIAQAELSRDAISQRVARAGNVVSRLHEEDRDDADVLAPTIDEVCEIMGWDNPTLRDLTGLQSEWQLTYDSLDALYWRVSEARGKVEDALYMIPNRLDYTAQEIEDEFEAIYYEYSDIVDMARNQY